MSTVAVERATRTNVLSKVWTFVKHHILTVYSLLFFVYLLLPIAIVVVFSFNNPPGKFNYVWHGFTLNNWIHWDAVPDLEVLSRGIERAIDRLTDDVVLRLDLEDAVAPSQKDRARTLIADAIPEVSRKGADVLVLADSNNWKIGVEYRPIDDLMLRGTVTTVFRAPNIGNIFASPTSSAPVSTDTAVATPSTTAR